MDSNINIKEDDLLNKCLEYCIDQNKLLYNLNEILIDKSFNNIHPTAILNTFANAKSLFDIDKNLIQIAIKV